MKKRMLIVVASCVLSGLVFASASWSQAPATPAPGPNAAFVTVQDGTRFYATEAQAFPEPKFLTLYGDDSARGKVARLMNQLREAEDDAKKAALTKELETAVAEYFDEDLKARETELTKLDERLTKLRAQLDRRRKAKAEIIQLQIKVMVNEADGLGFSGIPLANPRYGVGGMGGTGFSGDLLEVPVPANVPALTPTLKRSTGATGTTK